METTAQNLVGSLPDARAHEIVQVLISARGLRLERIACGAQVTVVQYAPHDLSHAGGLGAECN